MSTRKHTESTEFVKQGGRMRKTKTGQRKKGGRVGSLTKGQTKSFFSRLKERLTEKDEVRNSNYKISLPGTLQDLKTWVQLR